MEEKNVDELIDMSIEKEKGKLPVEERYDQYKKLTKKIKNCKIVCSIARTIASATLGFAIGTLISWPILVGQTNKKIDKTIAKTNYQEYNQEYKAKQLDDLNTLYKNGELSPADYLKNASALSDYNIDSYMKEQVSAEVSKQYFEYKNDQKHNGTYFPIASGISGGLSIAAAVTAIVSSKQEKKAILEKGNVL